ncbi:hypothetical protein BS50DRAFT_157774 [Corynespora cassiicola Philippines]|uniref:BHLH domain-containing protein n=1 Tax=Corynespora cassiicola Philippines TaxID=1448308 RepID=A0A2T2N8E8_CORCC|nr:hypothetical protein BS50DRAFT_157774 [Corynespora cassiicola Philippines]
MDFSDLSSYPLVANTDYSPTLDSFSYPETLDKAYLADAYTTSPDHSLTSFLDCESLFDRPVASVELPAGFSPGPKSSAVFNSSLPAAASASANLNSSSYRPSPYNPTPFGQLEQFPQGGFSFDAVRPGSFEISPQTVHSPTPSLCGDGAPPLQPSSPELSPRPLKRESPSSPPCITEEPAPKRPQRKRGRPRLDRKDSDTPSTSSSTKCARTTRLPHNQVERKYREGLNSELERLRRAVPTLPQSDEGGVMGQPKPSKAMVLAGAIDYIKKIEREREMLLAEVEALRGVRWGGRRSDPMDEFLVE